MAQLSNTPSFNPPETVAATVSGTGNFAVTLARPVAASRAAIYSLSVDSYYYTYAPNPVIAGYWKLATPVGGFHLQAVFVCTSYSGSGSHIIRGRVVEYSNNVLVQEVSLSFNVSTSEGTTDTTVGQQYRSSGAFFLSSYLFAFNWRLAFTAPLNDNQVRTTHKGSASYAAADYGFLISRR